MDAPKKWCALLLALVLFSGCTIVEFNKAVTDRHEIYVYGLGDTKARLVQEAKLKCGDLTPDMEKLQCGSICSVGKFKCKPGIVNAAAKK
jgi:hypothetical protein